MALDAKTISKVKEKAEKYFGKGKFANALETYEKISEYGEKDPRIFIRIGDIARRVEDNEKAIYYYTKASERFVKQGFIIKAIAVCKMVINIDPTRTDMEKRLAKLYEKEGMVQGVSSASAPPTPPTPVPAGDDDGAIIDPNLIEAPVEAAPQGEEQRRTFPRTPLFSDFTRQELIEVVSKVKFITFDEGKAVFKEGDKGTSIFIVVSGAMDVRGRTPEGEEILISHLKEGDFFGEFGFFANTNRKSTVVATTSTELLELTKSDLQTMIARHEGASQVIFDFYKERVVDRLMAISKAFRPMSAADRKEVLKRLTLATFDDGQDIMKEGEKGDTMYLIKSGTVQVWLAAGEGGGGKKVLSELKEGEFFGEIALATNKPRVATVTAMGKVEAVVFSKPMIKDILGRYPDIKDILLGVIKERVSDTAKAKEERAAIMT